MRTILTLLIYITLSVGGNGDPCTFSSKLNDILPSNWSYSTLDQVRTCFESISLNKTVVNQTMKQLFNSLDFYSFLSIVRQSQSPYFLNVDLENELLNIENHIFKNDYDFHMSVVNSFKKLNDYHTRYSAPKGYANFILLLPFIFEFLPLTQEIQIKREVKLYFSLMKNPSKINYTNKILTKIDNINAFDYISNFSQQYSSISKDKYVKLNSVFKEEFWWRNLADYPLPLRNNITFTFSNISITFPYLVIVTKQFHNRLHVENENLFSQPTPSFQNYITTFEKLDWYHENRSNSFEYIMGGKKTHYYSHKKTKTTIIKLASFDKEHFPDIKRAFLTAVGNTLILDLIGNHGGYSCIAYALLNYLIPEYSDLNNLYEPMDGRITKALQTFSTIFSFYSNSILNLETGQSFTNMDWIQSYRNYTRGNRTDSYSMKWSINCDGQVFDNGEFWIRNNTMSDKYFQSIYVLTDGICGSACSLFLSKLKFASNFKSIYGIGGGYYRNDLFESSSYAGGGAFSWNDIVTFYKIVNNNDSSINYLPTSAFLNMNVYEIYIKKLNSNCPREFVSQPIDKRVFSWDYFNLEAALEEIIYDDLASYGFSIQKRYNLLALIISSLSILILFLNYHY